MMNRKQQKKLTSTPELEKENVIQAVVITDSFNKNFAPATSSVALLPLVNRKLVNYTLEWLNISGVNEVILFCTSHANEIKQQVAEKVYMNIDIKVLVSEDCWSFGDVMRALDRYAVIRNTFILLSVDVIGNIKFVPIVEKFRTLQKVDKEASIMLLLKEVGNQRTDLQNNSIIAYNASNRLIYYYPNFSKTVDLSMEILLEQEYLDIRNDLLNPGIAVCSVAVPPLFSDNFDFQSLNDLIKDLLMDEEFQINTVYCEVLKESQYISKVSNWPMYQIVSQDVLRRWNYPLVPDLSEKYSYRKNSIYLKNVTFSKDCKLNFDIIIGSNTKLDKEVSIDNSVIGSNCLIGEKVVIENSFIFDKVRIERGSVIRFSVVSDDCYIKKNCNLVQNCILGQGVVLNENTKIHNVKLVTKKYPGSKNFLKFSDTCLYYKSASENSDSEDEEIPGLVTENNIPNDILFEDDASDCDSDTSSIAPVLDDVKIFYNEVIDSLTRGYEDKLKCENLILEINSSRYAYNVTVSEVNQNLIRAILNIGSCVENPSIKNILLHTQSKLKYFMPLLRNYIKNADAQRDCLIAIEDVVNSDSNLRTILPKIMHFLYDKEILNEEIIFMWYKNLSSEDHVELKRVLASFINWLNEAEEESDE